MLKEKNRTLREHFSAGGGLKKLLTAHFRPPCGGGYAYLSTSFRLVSHSPAISSYSSVKSALIAM